MRNSIILPLDYEKVFMLEARKSGLIKNSEIYDNIICHEIEQLENELFKRKYKTRQNLFQMILLYDELIIQNADPSYDYNNIKNMGSFLIYSFEEFCSYDAINQTDNELYAEYLKPAILNYIKKNLKTYFMYSSEDKEIYSKLISELYDLIFGIKKDLSKESIKLLEYEDVIYRLKNIKNIERMRKLNAPNILTDGRFLNEIVNWFIAIYEQLCWQLKISSEQGAYIVNSEFQLSKIGCDIYEESLNTYMEAYRILKCECSNIIENLPHMDSINDAISLKEKRRNDVKNLREVISNLENVLRYEGKEKAIEKAVNDVKKASSALSKCGNANKIGTWTTLLSVPMWVAEMLQGGNLGGLGLSVIGTATCLIDKKIKKDNSWCEIVR